MIRRSRAVQAKILFANNADIQTIWHSHEERCALRCLVLACLSDFSPNLRTVSLSMLSVDVVLAWDRRATLQVDPDVCVHELLERAQDALQQGISSLTTTSGQLLAGANCRTASASKRYCTHLRDTSQRDISSHLTYVIFMSCKDERSQQLWHTFCFKKTGCCE